MHLLSTLLWYIALRSHAKLTVHVKVILLSVRHAFKIGRVSVAGYEYQNSYEEYQFDGLYIHTVWDAGDI